MSSNKTDNNPQGRRQTQGTVLCLRVAKPFMGDLNYDNVIDANDRTILQSAIVGTVELSSLQEFLGDLNGDGVINSIDSFLIGGLINSQN